MGMASSSRCMRARRPQPPADTDPDTSGQQQPKEQQQLRGTICSSLEAASSRMSSMHTGWCAGHLWAHHLVGSGVSTSSCISATTRAACIHTTCIGALVNRTEQESRLMCREWSRSCWMQGQGGWLQGGGSETRARASEDLRFQSDSSNKMKSNLECSDSALPCITISCSAAHG